LKARHFERFYLVVHRFVATLGIFLGVGQNGCRGEFIRQGNRMKLGQAAKAPSFRQGCRNPASKDGKPRICAEARIERSQPPSMALDSGVLPE
jgi:hypothetical protein